MPLSPVATDNFSSYSAGTKLAASANWDAAVGTGIMICRGADNVEVDAAGTGAGSPGADYHTGTYTNNQYSQVLVDAGSSGDTYGGVAVQIIAADDDWYHLVGNELDTSGPYLEEVNAGSATTIAGYAIDGWDVGDEIRLEISSATLSAYLNEVLLGTSGSRTYTGGKPGLAGFPSGAFPRYDDWEGGDVTAAGGDPESNLIGGKLLNGGLLVGAGNLLGR